MIYFREGGQKDIPQLTKVAQMTYMDAFGHSFQPEDLDAHLTANLSEIAFKEILSRDSILVAVDDEKIIGFIQFGQAEGYDGIITDHDWAIKRLYVLRDYQNKGIGSQLMYKSLEVMKANMVKRVFLDVWEHNPGAIRFYQRFGFEVVTRLKFEVASGAETSDDLVMRCAL
jgi:ribosomal protein S18 acetylase RimI-like enzyme